MKKINCKHGLEKKGELEARNLRKILIGERVDYNDDLKNRIKDLYARFCKDNDTTYSVFYYYISQKDLVLFSALERCMSVADFSQYMRENNLMSH